jgi:hypothetical protein
VGALTWDVTLYGGPFDGDEAETDDPLPAALYVVPCRKCGTHWYAERKSGGEVYQQDELNADTKEAKYVWSDLGVGRGKGTREWKPLGYTKKDIELVPA